MAGFASPLEKTETATVEELERLLQGDYVTDEQLEAMEYAFAQAEESPDEEVLWRRCFDWGLPSSRLDPKDEPLTSIPRLREYIMSLPDESFILVHPRDESWFTQCAFDGGEWMVECSLRIGDANHVRTLEKEEGNPWTAHEVFLVMATFIRSRDIDRGYASTVTLY